MEPTLLTHRSHRHLSRLFVAVALLAVAASLLKAPSIATGTNETVGNYQTETSLFGRKWKLTHVGDMKIPSAKPYILLNAQTKRFEGDGGCNRISGAFEVSKSALTFARVISTRRACADRRLQQVETKFVESLERTSSFYILGNSMRFYANGVAILTFKAAPGAPTGRPISRALQPNSLCARDEQIIFSCRLKRPAKIVSLCASPDLAREQGYLQYRFGLPARIELEFPESRQATQEQFEYTHYFRYQVDLTEINFSIEGNRYQIFDAYNGEEKPRVIQYGVMIVPPRRESVSYHCRTRPKADYIKLADALRDH
jgi:heat shock protein HslJ